MATVQRRLDPDQGICSRLASALSGAATARIRISSDSSGLHLLHHPGPVYLDRAGTDAEVIANGLVGMTLHQNRGLRSRGVGAARHEDSAAVSLCRFWSRWLRSRAARIAPRRSSSSKGFSRNSTAPAFMASNGHGRCRHGRSSRSPAAPVRARLSRLQPASARPSPASARRLAMQPCGGSSRVDLRGNRQRRGVAYAPETLPT